MNEQIKIALLAGSIAFQSHTKTALRYLEACLKQAGAVTHFWDLQSHPLPITQPEYHWATHNHPDTLVREFVKHINTSQAIALGSPLYHGSYSGVLKNALDNLHYDAFRNKPVALVSHGSSIRRTTQPCEHLRTVVGTMYGYSTQTLVATTKSDYQLVNGQLELINPEIMERIQRQATELMQLARLLQGQNLVKED